MTRFAGPAARGPAQRSSEGSSRDTSLEPPGRRSGSPRERPFARRGAVVLTLVTLLLALLPLVAHADAQDDAVRRIALQLQCPVCEGETVADSPSGLANDMRNVIRQKVAAGEPDQQILDEFVASYGDGILTEPPKHGISLGVWVGPVIAVTFGGALLALLLRNWRRPAASPAAAVTPEAEVSAELARFREEFGA